MDSPLIQQQTWRIIDQTNLGPSFEAKQSFAMDDALCEAVGSGESPPTARTWVHPRTVVLGSQDTRLPYLEKGLKYLEQQGFNYIVRNSGGLAVVLDEGVLNLSLIFPENEGKISIDAGYDAMVAFVHRMFVAFNLDLDVREVETSYCPGRYDLSVGGKKFAGISQRRIRNSVAVQIYLCADGSGSERAALIQNFYKIGLSGETTRFKYPEIEPETMASLTEITGQKLNASRLMALFYMTISELGNVKIEQLKLDEIKRFHTYYERMIDRNEKVFGK